MKIILAGGTGFIGRALLRRLLDDGHEVVLLTRREKPFTGFHQDQLRLARWDGRTGGQWCSHFDGADAVINLSGESIADKRWTARRKQILRQSRLEATRALVGAIRASQPKPSVLINASAVGYYGDVRTGEVTERAAQGHDFLAGLCGDWEKEALQAQELGVRTVLARLGVVLAPDGGALSRFIPPFGWFIGGPLGSGKQWFPWIHRDDVVGAIVHLMTHKAARGPVNLTAPEVLTLRQFCNELGRAMNRPSWLPVPSLVLRLLLGEMAVMILTGQKAVPAELIRTGYTYRYPHVHEALGRIFESE